MHASSHCIANTMTNARKPYRKRGLLNLGSSNNHFASAEEVEAMIAAARARMGKEPNVADVWAEVFDQVDRVLENAVRQRRGVYFGNV